MSQVSSFFTNAFSGFLSLGILAVFFLIFSYLFYRFRRPMLILSTLSLGHSIWIEKTDMACYVTVQILGTFCLTEPQERIINIIEISLLLTFCIYRLSRRELIKYFSYIYLILTGPQILFCVVLSGLWDGFLNESLYYRHSKIFRLLATSRTEIKSYVKHELDFHDNDFINQIVLNQRFIFNKSEAKWFMSQNKVVQIDYLDLLYKCESASGQTTGEELGISPRNNLISILLVQLFSPGFGKIREKNMRRYGLHLWGDQFFHFHASSH